MVQLASSAAAPTVQLKIESKATVCDSRRVPYALVFIQLFILFRRNDRSGKRLERFYAVTLARSRANRFHSGETPAIGRATAFGTMCL